MPDFIAFNDVSFAYPRAEKSKHTALDGIRLTIQAGEFIALIGPNGSGKSTLARLMNALLLPDSGQVLIDGMDTREREQHARIRSQVGLVFQRPQNQIVATTVEEDVAFGPANFGLSSQEIDARVGAALEQTGLSDYRQRSSHLLSAGETQRLALAGVLAMQPRCIIFDESTAMLDPAGREMVMAQIGALHRQGITVVLITHLMEEAAQAERIILLHEGKLITEGKPQQIFSSNLAIERYGLAQPPAQNAAQRLQAFFPDLPDNILTTQALLKALPNHKSSKKSAARHVKNVLTPDEGIIRIRDLSFTYQYGTPLAHQALNQLNLHVQPGHTHALIGSTGCGKSTLLQHINGLLRPQSGQVLVGPFDLSDTELDTRALHRLTALAFQQPEDQLFEQYVGDEIAYAPRHLGYSGKLAEIVAQAMQSVGLDFESYKDRMTANLSGGEKRKVALASILAIQADMLLLDEPLAGLDPRSTNELLKTLVEQQRQGKTILLSTHQYGDLIPILQDASLLAHGRDVLHDKAENVFSQTETLESNGLRAPLAALLADELRRKGWPLEKPIATLDSLVNELSRISKGGEKHE